ncbi:MAG: DHA2 family efflux MFS transporter permease subunit [Phycisphaerales bacterium]|jgi:EmrB/QacA subfamily drug resistance transporter
MSELGVTQQDLARAGAGHKWWTLAVIGSGTFMSALDTSVVNVALPVIQRTTRSPVSTVEWVILIYLITVSSSLLVFGRLADLHGTRRIYITGQLTFVFGSLCCGLSGRIGLLILSRAVQAVGAAMIFALSPSILIGAFPASERGRALGMQATMTYLGMSIGPGLGGFLTQHFGWPAIFFINLPVGFCMTAVAARVLRPDRPGAGRPFDPAGASTMATALASLLFVLSKGEDLGWRHPLILGLIGVAACSGVAFVLIERRSSHPALDLKLFHDRTFTASVLAAYLCYLSTASVTFLMSFHLLSAVGCSASHAGMVLMAVPLAMMVLTAPSGALSDRVGVRFPATVGMLVMACGIGLLAGIGPQTATARIAAYLALAGAGVGLFTAPNNSAIMGSVPLERRGVAGAILAAARTVGFASGVAMAGMIYQICLDGGRTGSAEGIAHAVRAGMHATVLAALSGAACSALRGRRMTMPAG